MNTVENQNAISVELAESVGSVQSSKCTFPAVRDGNMVHDVVVTQSGLFRRLHTPYRILALVALSIVLSGCGGSPPPTKAKAAVKPVAAAPALLGNPPTARNEAPRPGGRRPVVADKGNGLPPGTDPRSVFVVGEVGTPMDVSAPLRVRPEELFAVVSGDLGFDASRMVVGGVPRPSKPGTQRSGFTLPKGFIAITAAGYSEEGLPLRIQCEKSATTMALVPAGVVRMGSHEGPAECQPEFSVNLDAFYLDVFEVTVGDFEKYRLDQKENKKPIPPISNPTASPTTPVLGVPWGMAGGYARWLGMELPTEAEFEKAARGPESFRTPWGNGRAIWPMPRTPETLTVVGAYANDKSPYGIYDLAGNAKEWCSDFYSEQSHRDALASSNQTPRNWAGPKKSSSGNNLRVVKGGASDWSAWRRQGRDIGKVFNDVGFRCALKVTVPEGK